jgi:serine/threonine-protein kinase
LPRDFGPYELIREVGRGGMGVVYEARDTALDRTVALKLIQERFTQPQSVQQFLLEARAVARITHPNIVVLYDIGLMDLKHYITMELVRGGSLEKWIEHEGKLPLQTALRLFVEMARALQMAHDAGVVHRDIKPGNILLNERREVKIVDFGLAKLHQAADEGHEVEGKTIFSAAGTPGYMAPEQIRGEESRPRADVYALGVVLFYMLAGVPPHRAAGKAGNMKILSFQLDGKLPSLKEHAPAIPDHIEQLYRYCTALNPEERYQGIDAFLPAAEEWLAAAAAPRRGAMAPAGAA